MAPKSSDGRVNILKTVVTPLSFMVLVLLMVESLLGAMAFQFNDYRGMLIWTIIIFFAAFTLLVLALAILRPEVLKGNRGWDENYANRIADDIYFSVEGYLRNLSDDELVEAWHSLSEIFNSQDTKDVEFNLFCKKIGGRITKKADLYVRGAPVQGKLSN